MHNNHLLKWTGAVITNFISFSLFVGCVGSANNSDTDWVSDNKETDQQISHDGTIGSTKWTRIDSLTYDLGVAQSQGLKQYMSLQLGVDTANIDEFIKGMKEGAVIEADPKKEAYVKGGDVGKQIQQMAMGLSTEVYGDDSTKTVNIQVLLRASSVA